MNGSVKQKKGLGALDWVILILAVFIAGSFVLRYMNLEEKGLRQDSVLDDYVLTVEITGIREESANSYFNEDTQFYFTDTGKYLGKILSSNPNSTSQYYELLDGTVQNVPMVTEEAKDLLRMDVSAEIQVKGQYKNGSFYHESNKVIGLNKEIAICSKFVSVTAVVTSIRSAQSAQSGQQSEKQDAVSGDNTANP